ncbi:antitoxin Xre/MbcA/ParS toxin-binding domain-containing protein [Sulfitobacter sp. M13]|tara:strand:- start:71 stop:490 length:420 start_codon:yes stop_codon:yes gene_type:complete
MTTKLTRSTDVERVAEILGLPEEINDSASLEVNIECGLPASSVEKILAVMYSRPVLELIPERAFRRAKSEKIPLSRTKSQILYDFSRAYVVVDRVHQGHGALVMRFLEKPNPDLGGAVPMALAISSPAGADAVIELLTR